MKPIIRLEYQADEILPVAQKLEQLRNRAHVFTFTGPLGAGKTTLIKEFLKLCGVQEIVTSPTFTYVNVYTNTQGQTFYHFDLYRLHTLDDFIAAGFDEYLYAPLSWSCVEWPENIMSLLTHNVCHVSIEYHEQPDKRIVTVTCK